MQRELLYIRIADTVEKQIRNNVLNAGDRLPSLRTVCQEHGVSMNTASEAYLELERRALIESRPQSGFFVALYRKPAMPTVSKPSVSYKAEQADDLIRRVFETLNDTQITRLALGVPDMELLPIAKLNKAMSEALRTLPSSGTGYDDVQGNGKLRRQIARWSFTWNSSLTESDIVTTAGTMNAISHCLMVLTKRGDAIAVESPAYFGILQLAKNLGLRVIELPTHPVTGIEPDALKKVLPKIKACVLVSNFSNPLGSCMPEINKKAVVKMLAAEEIPLIEDDLYGDIYFRSSRPTPCKAFDREGLVLWCGSVSKTLAPGYRVGWVAPGRFKDEIIRSKLLHSISLTTITHEVVANVLENGRYENHLRNLRRTLYANSQQFVRAISEYFPAETRVTHPEGGFVLWTEMDKRIDAASLYEKAMQHKISIAPGRMFTLQNQFNNCMRLSYGVKWTDELDSKLKQLGVLAKSMLKR